MTPEQADACFDFDRMYDELCGELGNSALLRSSSERKQFKQGMEKQFVDEPPFADYQASEIRNVKRLTDADNVIVFTKHLKTDGQTGKMRWWARRARDKWRWYDYEYLEVSFRLTSMQAAMVNSTPQQQAAVDHINKASSFLGESKFDEAGAELRATLGQPVPKAFDATRHWELAIVHLNADQPEEALKEIDQAEALVSDIPMLPMLRARAFNALGRFEEAAAQARIYLEALGADDFGSWLLGTALAGQGKKEEAAEAFRAGFADNASSVNDLVGLAGVLPDDQMSEIGERFATFQRPAAHFVEVASQLIDNDRTAALAAVVAKQREIAPNDPHNDYYQGEVHWARQEYDQAAEAFQKAFDQAPDGERERFGNALRNALLEAGKPIEAYRALAEREDTFRIICNRLLEQWRPAETISELIAAHAERMPDDPWLVYYRGRSLMRQHYFNRAAELLRPLTESADNQELKQSAAEAYSEALVYGGKPLEGYAASVDRADGFETAAAYLVHRRDSEGLTALIDRHAADYPDDESLAYYRARLADINNDYQTVAEILVPALAANEDGRDRMALLLRTTLYEIHRPLEAYKALRPDEGFLLAWSLVNSGDLAALEQLFAAHEARQADDPRLPYFRGYIARMQGEDEKAAAAFTEWFKLPSGEEDNEDSILDNYLESMAAAHSPLQAYSEVADGERAFRPLADALARRGDVDLLQRLIEVHAEDHSEDPWLGYWRGRTHLLRGKTDEALAAFQPALQAVGDDDRELAAAALSEFLIIGRPLDAYRPVASSPNAIWVFEYLGNVLTADQDYGRLQELITAHQENHADDPKIALFQAERLSAMGKHDEVVDLLKPLLSEADDFIAERRETLYEEAMLKLGRWRELYDAATYKKAVFAELASQLYAARDADALRQLIDAHRAVDPKEPLLSLHMGRALRLKRKDDEAERVFTEITNDLDAEPTWSSAINERIETRFDTGKAISAYEEIGPRRATFNSLLELCRDKRDAAQFEQLVAAHRQRFPDDADLPWWELEILGLKGNDEASLRALEQPSGPLTHSATGAAFRLRVRAMVRLKRFEQARELVKDYEQHTPSPYYRAEVEAAAGNIAAATVALHDLLRSGYDVQEIYQDPVLGPALASDAFADFRDRHPEWRAADEHGT